MNTVSQIQSAINSKKPISFWYSYSHPDTNRVVEPMSLANGSLVARENGAVKRFNIDGINLIKSDIILSKTNGAIETINEMIKCNATMVFTYSFSQPEKVRFASPIEIKGDIVIAVEADTGKYKSFKLEGIYFVGAKENREVEDEEIEDEENVEDEVEEGEIVSEDEEKEVSLEKMIVQAITSLKYRGCSRPAIRKYIIDNFNISSYTLDRKLHIALKRGVDSGVLIQNGQHFKLNKAKKNVKLEDSPHDDPRSPEQRLQNLVQKHIDYKEPMTFKYLFSKPDLVRTFYPESIKNYIVTGKENGKYKSFALTGINIVQEVSSQEVKYYDNLNVSGNRQKKEEYTLKNGKKDGLYQYYLKNGQKMMESNYKDDKLNGFHQEWYSNGQKRVECTFKDGKHDGLFTSWNTTGEKLGEFYYRNGNLDVSGNIVEQSEDLTNEITSFHENGVMRERFTLKNGKHDGLYQCWWDNGQKLIECTYLDDKFNGSYQSWCENGQKRAECHYRDGKLEGLCKVWDNKGNLKECHYKNGELVEAPVNEKVEWHENGVMKAKYTLKNGKKDGLYQGWWDNGQKYMEIHYRDGKKNGLYQVWYNNGQKHIECQYRDDKKEGLYQQLWDNGQKMVKIHYREGLEDGFCQAWNREGQKDIECHYRNGELVDPSEAPTVPCSPSGVDEPTLPEVKVNTNDFIFQKVEEEANMDIYDDYGMLKLTRRDAFVKKPKNYKGLIGRRIRIELPYDIKEDVYVFNVVDEIAYVEFPNGEQIRLDMNETPYKVLPRSNEYMHFKQLENKTISFVHTRLNIPVKITISNIEELYVEDAVVVRGIVNGKEVVILSDEIENFKIEV